MRLFLPIQNTAFLTDDLILRAMSLLNVLSCFFIFYTRVQGWPVSFVRGDEVQPSGLRESAAQNGGRSDSHGHGEMTERQKQEANHKELMVEARSAVLIKRTPPLVTTISPTHSPPT